MITELFGEEILDATLDEVKKRIRMLPPSQLERKHYLLHDWSAITEHELTQQDFIDVSD